MDVDGANLLLTKLFTCDLVGIFLELVFLRALGLLVRREEEAEVLLGKDAHRESVHLNRVKKKYAIRSFRSLRIILGLKL